MAAGAPPRTLCRRPDRPRSPASCIAKPGGCLAALGGRTHTIPPLAGKGKVRRPHGKNFYPFLYKKPTEDPFIRAAPPPPIVLRPADARGQHIGEDEHAVV